MQEKSTLTIYRKYKHSIKDEQNLYDNSAGTTTLFEARTGTLQLNDTKRHTNGETSCELCGYHYENCEHFLLHCTLYIDSDFGPPKKDGEFLFFDFSDTNLVNPLKFSKLSPPKY